MKKAPVMTATANQVPKKHGEFFFDPPFSQWKEEALRNRERLIKETFWGQSALKVRGVLKLPTDHPLILSGHQPVFFHPGLWIKCLAASTLAESVSGAACHKVTDTALAPEFVHHLPELEDNGRARLRALEFFTNKDLKEQEKLVPYAYLAAPDFAAIQKIFSDGQVYCPPAVREPMRIYEEKLMKGLKENPTWDEFHIYTLKLLDEICGTRRTYLTASKIWASEPFFQFLATWCSNLPSLTEAYNLSLDEYRKNHGITHELTPMPNLKFQDWFFELPFWGVTKYHQRHSLWAKNDGKHLILKVKGGDGTYSIALDNLKQELGTLPLTIWPKAIPQTLFCRMYLCDYFVHGIGGSIYEEVGDAFFEKVFKLKPLDFGTASATYLVDPAESKGIDLILNYEAKMDWWERALANNPEYLFTRQEVWHQELPSFMHPVFQACVDNPALKALADEKTRLVQSLKDAPKKDEVGKKIKEVNFTLYDGYTEILKVLEQGLMDAAHVKEAQGVLANREFPFFCFKPELFVDMKEKIRAAAGHT